MNATIREVGSHLSEALAHHPIFPVSGFVNFFHFYLNGKGMEQVFARYAHAKKAGDKQGESEALKEIIAGMIQLSADTSFVAKEGLTLAALLQHGSEVDIDIHAGTHLGQGAAITGEIVGTVLLSLVYAIGSKRNLSDLKEQNKFLEAFKKAEADGNLMDFFEQELAATDDEVFERIGHEFFG